MFALQIEKIARFPRLCMKPDWVWQKDSSLPKIGEKPALSVRYGPYQSDVCTNDKLVILSDGRKLS